jgi:hypothetical protein
MKNLFIVITLLLCIPLSVSSHAADLYRITLLRAAPASFATLLEEAKQLRKKQKGDLIIMRHSQGDQWDLMLLDPAAKSPATELKFSSSMAFQHSFLAESDASWQKLRKSSENNDLYHIEMFHAAPNKLAELIKQREMENAYYHATQRAGNIIFTTTFGSDVDVFTVGFYQDLKTFATDPDLSEQTYAKAATDAGFKSRSSIGLYLRSLMSSHHDTLAVKVD